MLMLNQVKHSFGSNRLLNRLRLEIVVGFEQRNKARNVSFPQLHYNVDIARHARDRVEVCGYRSGNHISDAGSFEASCHLFQNVQLLAHELSSRRTCFSCECIRSHLYLEHKKLTHQVTTSSFLLRLFNALRRFKVQCSRFKGRAAGWGGLPCFENSQNVDMIKNNDLTG